MSFDWSDYLRLAYELSRQTRRSSLKNAKLRSSISRAYYAAFIIARNFLRDRLKIALVSADVHQFVITQFRSNSDPIYQEIGRNLLLLRRARNRADYDDNFRDLIP